MIPENPNIQAQEEEKYRVLSRAPLTATFLKGNANNPEWAHMVMGESDRTIIEIMRAVGIIDTKGFNGMSKDHGNVLISMGFELGSQHNIGLLHEDLVKRVLELQWILPEELARYPERPSPEGVVWTFLTSGIVYRLCVSLSSPRPVSQM